MSGEVPAVDRRPGNVGPGNRSEIKLSSRFPGPTTCALQSAGLATLHFYLSVWRVAPLTPLEKKRGRTDVPMARRPVRRPAATDACVRSRRASHRRQAISGSPVVLPRVSASPRNPSDRLFVWADGWAAFVSLCLRVCDVGRWAALRSSLCVPSLCLCVSVPLWFCRCPWRLGRGESSTKQKTEQAYRRRRDRPELVASTCHLPRGAPMSSGDR